VRNAVDDPRQPDRIACEAPRRWDLRSRRGKSPPVRNLLHSPDHPRRAPYMRVRKKQISMCSLQSLTCSQVQVLPRQWMVGPSSDSRLWLGETPARASSAVNGRASRWRKLPARTGQPL
jgi:hypothetical protein